MSFTYGTQTTNNVRTALKYVIVEVIDETTFIRCEITEFCVLLQVTDTFNCVNQQFYRFVVDFVHIFNVCI